MIKVQLTEQIMLDKKIVLDIFTSLTDADLITL